MQNLIQVFARARCGNVAILFGLMTPLLLALAGAGLDYSKYSSIRTDLRDIADMAALAGARQYALSGTQTPNRENLPKVVAENVIRKMLAELSFGKATIFEVRTFDGDYSVQVTIKSEFDPTMLVGMFEKPLKVELTSVASSGGRTRSASSFRRSPTTSPCMLMTMRCCLETVVPFTSIQAIPRP